MLFVFAPPTGLRTKDCLLDTYIVFQVIIIKKMFHRIEKVARCGLCITTKSNISLSRCWMLSLLPTHQTLFNSSCPSSRTTASQEQSAQKENTILLQSSLVSFTLHTFPIKSTLRMGFQSIES